jgi:hypothetical protein
VFPSIYPGLVVVNYFPSWDIQMLLEESKVGHGWLILGGEILLISPHEASSASQ